MIVIYTKFDKLAPEKKERIINAALAEFARNGYAKASTNTIISEAGISKGSLFNYFISKKDLFLYLLGYSAQIIDKIYDEIDYNKTDLFDRFMEAGFIKLEIIKKYPGIFDFFKTIEIEKAPEVSADIEKTRQALINKGFNRIYENIDFSKFREDIDIGKTVEIINWVTLGYGEQQRAKLDSYNNMNMEEAIRIWGEYADLLKRCFYKPEYL